MTRFVKNADGAVHSVPDDFRLPTGWSEASESDAHPALLGNDQDTAVTAVSTHDRSTLPVAETPSTGTIGVQDTRKLDIEPPAPTTVFPDGKPETYPNGTDAVANATPVGETAPLPADEGGPVQDHEATA